MPPAHPGIIDDASDVFGSFVVKIPTNPFKVKRIKFPPLDHLRHPFTAGAVEDFSEDRDGDIGINVSGARLIHHSRAVRYMAWRK
jgi:hypothetical protein